MAEWKPNYPYIHFKGFGRHVGYDADGNKVEEYTEQDNFHHVTGCHITIESLNNIRGEGWGPIIDYNFDYPVSFGPHSPLYSQRPDYQALARYMEQNFRVELEQGRKAKAAAAAAAEPVKKVAEDVGAGKPKAVSAGESSKKSV